MKPVWKSKTFWLNFLTFVIALMILLATYTGFAGDRLIRAETGQYLLLVASILNLVLRAVTHEPLDLSLITGRKP